MCARFHVYAGAISGNFATSRYSQAELEEQMSQYFINARDRSGGRKERSARRRQQQLAGETSAAGPQTIVSTLHNSSCRLFYSTLMTETPAA